MIVEIGSERGEHTRALALYCKAMQGVLHSIDPAPAFDTRLLQEECGSSIIFHRDLSLNALPRIRSADAVIIDGDHNWYTVLHELLLLEQLSKEQEYLPLTILHDVGWPYGRRDQYMVPERIPEAHRLPYEQKGMVEGTGMLQERGGFNATANNAIYEHGIANGVRTAVEDFLKRSSLPCTFITIPGFYGIGILADTRLLQARKPLQSLLKSLALSELAESHLTALERARIETVIKKEELASAYATQQHMLFAAERRLEESSVHAAKAAAEQQRIIVTLEKRLEEIQQEQERVRKEMTEHFQSQLQEREHHFEKTLNDAHARAAFIQRTLERELAKTQDVIGRMERSKSWRWTAWVRLLEADLRTVFPFVRRRVSPPATPPPPGDSRPIHGGLIGCTIVSRNFMAQARVLAHSFLTQHPDASFYVLLVDEASGTPVDVHDRFTVIGIESVGIPDWKELAFSYDLREFHTAVKPGFLRWILTQKQPRALLYLDPDIRVFAPFDAAIDALEAHSILLTPHLTVPPQDRRRPTALDILKVGTYNLGFIGLAYGEETDRFLQWWEDRIREGCSEEPSASIFFDQRWIDLVPSLFPGCHILRDPGYNVAFWNLAERPLDRSGDNLTVQGLPLCFFHFSGFEPDHPERLSKYDINERSAKDFAHVAALLLDYREDLMNAGYASSIAHPYSFGRFQNGTPIPVCIRRAYHALPHTRKSGYGDPFSCTKGSYWDFLQSCHTRLSETTFLTQAQRILYESDPSLALIFPSFDARFAHWLLEQHPPCGYALPNALLTSLDLLNVSAPQTSFVHRLLHLRHRSNIYDRTKELMRRLLPAALFARIRQYLQQHDLRSHALPISTAIVRAEGCNIVGYFETPNGVGEVARSLAAAARAHAIPLALHTIHVAGQTSLRTLLPGPLRSDHPYDVTILCANADQVEHVIRHEGRKFLDGHRRIGYWCWELSKFPDAWQEQSRFFDEIWTLSSFCTHAIAPEVSCPVLTVPPAILLSDQLQYTRSTLGLPEQRFLFLFMFDVQSIIERKNPFAVIEAFKRAFRPEEPVTLVLKYTNADASAGLRDKLHTATENASILLMDEPLSREASHGLIRAADSYISLHRSEGFGLTIAEAMACAKPVIATGYSGNMDFMTPENSFPVRYELRELQEDAGPYARGNSWAEPDIDHAAALMRQVYSDREEARRKGERAAADIAHTLSPQAIGALMHARFAALRQQNAR